MLTSGSAKDGNPVTSPTCTVTPFGRFVGMIALGSKNRVLFKAALCC